MGQEAWKDSLDQWIERLKTAPWRDRESVKEGLLQFSRDNLSERLKETLSASRKSLKLELRWEIDEILEALEPPEEPEAPAEEAPEEVEEPQDAAPLSMADLVPVYDDPRGLTLYTDKAGERWFATQMDPRSGRPATFEVPPHQVPQIRAQLMGSPYWLRKPGDADQ